jgi:aromatic amino acid aminotransferase I
MLCARGDYFLTEDFTYSSAIETASPTGVKAVGIPIDEQGLIPEELEKALSSWDPTKRDGAKKPHVLYTIPTGHNPTGSTQSKERRQELYKICQKHDVIIVEDEPYYFLQMDPYIVPDINSETEPEVPVPKTPAELLASLVPSYLSMDTDGRVIRLESFSKVIAPGSRTGWIVANAQFIERICRHNETCVQNPSGLSQITLFKLLDETWGHNGYLEWLGYIRSEYTQRRNWILNAMEKYVPKEVASWYPPMAGMFVSLYDYIC